MFFFQKDLAPMPFMVIVSDTSVLAAISRVQPHQTDEGLRSWSIEFYVNRTISSSGAAYIVFDINMYCLLPLKSSQLVWNIGFKFEDEITDIPEIRVLPLILGLSNFRGDCWGRRVQN